LERKNAIFINVRRGDVIKEEVFEALDKGWFRQAILDVLFWMYLLRSRCQQKTNCGHTLILQSLHIVPVLLNLDM